MKQKCLLAAAIFCLLPSILIGSPSAEPLDASPEAYSARLDSVDNYIKRERWSDAAASIRECLRMRPASPINSKLFCNLGICLTNAADYSGAAEAFELALVREPDSPQTLTSRGVMLTLTGQLDEAAADFSRSLAIDSLQPVALRSHGQIMIARADTAAAASDFRILRRHFPSEAWGPAGLAEVAILRSDNSAAIPLLREAINISDQPDFHISLISTFLASNRLAEAEEAIREAIALYPREGELYLLRGVLHRTLLQNDLAASDKKIAIEYGVDPQTIERYLPSAGSKSGSKK